MIKDFVTLWKPDEYSFPLAFGFIPDLALYLHEDAAIRPAVLVIPGGGYAMVADSEAELVALRFFRMGYQAFVCTYTTNLRVPVPLKKQPLMDVSRALRHLRLHADEYRLNPRQIAVCGFSAGGHLAASLCVHYSDICDPDSTLDLCSNRPDASILCYPVICSHPDTITNLLGAHPSQEEIDYFSLDRQVSEDTPPAFLWHTATDETVSADNSICYARALMRKQIPCACHIFSAGPHGLSVDSPEWEQGLFGENHTSDQTLRIVRQIRAGHLPAPNNDMERLKRYDDPQTIRELNALHHVVKEVSVWPELVHDWLDSLFSS